MAETATRAAAFRLGAVLLLAGALAPAPSSCASGAASLDDAREAYRAGRLSRAGRILGRVLGDEPGNGDALVLLGFVRYREGRHGEAADAFTRALRIVDEDPDAHYGLGLVERARGNPAAARTHAERAAALAPDRDDLGGFLSALLAELEAPPSPADPSDATLPPYERPADLRVPFVARDGFLRRGGGTPLLVRGVNLGVALPGRFPSQFPEGQATYDEWLAWIGAMGANAVRVYTVHPPAFYRSLRAYNLAHPDRPLLVIHGVWAEVPADDDYRGAFEEAFLDEARRVVDLLHGQARIPPRPGHASGTYAADVSPWLLALLVGREFEPWSVRAFDALARAEGGHRGRYLEAEDASPMEAWLARVMDRITAYQVERHNQQTPIAFTSWPTLDPLRHPTESSWHEEVVFRRAQGERLGETEGPPFDEDEAQVDAARIRATASFAAGTFAAYHVYPYYPDFMRLDPGYAAHPRSAYAAYLADLAAHHRDQPVLVAEFGVPSSRGRSHVGPAGRDHGGLSEADQARIVLDLWREIAGEGLAGGVVFSFVDEWFKTNWRWVPLEIPAERRVAWHNLMNPEQSFGLVAATAPETMPLRGPQPSWDELPALARSRGAKLAAHADAEYLHVVVVSRGLERLELEIDTHPAAGAEFEVALAPGEGRLRVNEAYRLFREYESGRPWAYHEHDPEASPRPGAPFADLVTQINRRRFGRDGTEHARVLDELGRLREGRDPPGARDSRADYELTERGVHLRLPWTLIGFTDPGARRIFDGRTPGKTLVVDGVGLRARSGAIELSGRFTWAGWEAPAYALRRKPAYYALKGAWVTGR